MKSRAVFLDRDGVINRPVIRDGKAFAPKGLDDLEIYPGLGKQVQRIKDKGFVILVVTNQPDVVRGTTTMEVVEAINSAILKEIPAIDKIYACFHDNSDKCDCRKPKPGMLHAGAKDFNLDLRRSYIIGDRKGDMEAGIAAGSTIYVDHDYANESQPTHYNHRAVSTSDALDIIWAEADLI